MEKFFGNLGSIIFLIWIILDVVFWFYFCFKAKQQSPKKMYQQVIGIHILLATICWICLTFYETDFSWGLLVLVFFIGICIGSMIAVYNYEEMREIAFKAIKFKIKRRS